MLCVKVFRTKGLYEEAYHASMRDVLFIGTSSVCYLAAVIYTGMEYFGDDSSSGDRESYPKQYEEKDEEHRVLAGTSSSFYSDGSQTDVAAWLCLSGAFGSVVIMTFIYAIRFDYLKRCGVDIRKYVVDFSSMLDSSPVWCCGYLVVSHINYAPSCIHQADSSHEH